MLRPVLNRGVRPVLRSTCCQDCGTLGHCPARRLSGNSQGQLRGFLPCHGPRGSGTPGNLYRQGFLPLRPARRRRWPRRSRRFDNVPSRVPGARSEHRSAVRPGFPTGSIAVPNRAISSCLSPTPFVSHRLGANLGFPRQTTLPYSHWVDKTGRGEDIPQFLAESRDRRSFGKLRMTILERLLSSRACRGISATHCGNAPVSLTEIGFAPVCWCF